jgi:hypothetical protein
MDAYIRKIQTLAAALGAITAALVAYAGATLTSRYAARREYLTAESERLQTLIQLEDWTDQLLWLAMDLYESLFEHDAPEWDVADKN